MKFIKTKYQVLLLILPWSFAFISIINMYNFIINHKIKMLIEIVIRIFILGSIFFILVPFIINQYLGLDFYFSNSLAWLLYSQGLSTLISIYVIRHQRLKLNI